MSDLDIQLERVVNATPEVAFKRWVDAEARRQWYAPEDGWIVEAETDLRVGGNGESCSGPPARRCTSNTGCSKRSSRPIDSSTPRSTSFPTTGSRTTHESP